MKRYLFLILAAVLVLSACGGFQIGDSESSNSSEEDSASGDTEGSDAEGSNDEKVTLDFWSFWGSEQRRPVIDKIIEDFNSSG